MLGSQDQSSGRLRVQVHWLGGWYAFWREDPAPHLGEQMNKENDLQAVTFGKSNKPIY